MTKFHKFGVPIR